MSLEIPEPFVRDDAFRLFYENLDEKDRVVFKALFSVAADRNDQSALSNLVTAVNNFFSASPSGRGYNGNSTEVDDFIKTVSSLVIPVSDEGVDFVRKWLVNHIGGGESS